MNLFLTAVRSHGLTFFFIFLELVFFFLQVNDLLRYPRRRWQWWYLWLLVLLILFNIGNGWLPDPGLGWDMRLQYLLADGTAYLAGAYFPFYFYKHFRLRRLRPWVTWGVAAAILVPFFFGEVPVYLVTGDLWADRRWAALLPCLYGLVILALLFREVRRAYREKGDRMAYECGLLVLACFVPWEAMVLFAFFPLPPVLKIWMANQGWVVITLLRMGAYNRIVRRDENILRALFFEDIDPAVLSENAKKAGLSARETEILLLLRERKSSSEIAEQLFVSDWTIKSHVKNMFRKTGTNSRAQLLRKLGDTDFCP